jgi:conjugal transfer pilus assembly protein TraV
MNRLPYLLGATSLSLALFTVSCTTLVTHVKGGFACKAPVGTCAPMSNIDAEALAALGAGDGGGRPISGSGRGRDPNLILASADGVPVRTGERTMKVVFPAHSDANGVYHEEAVAHVVAEWSRWTLRPLQAPASDSLDAAIAKDAPNSQMQAMPVASALGDPTSSAPQNLREAAAGLAAPADPAPDPAGEQVAVDIPASDAGAPSAAALTAARAGHRIGQPSVMQAATSHAAPQDHHHARPPSKASPTVPGAATAALNRDSLQRLLAGGVLSNIGTDGGPVPRGRLAAAASLATNSQGVRP